MECDYEIWGIQATHLLGVTIGRDPFFNSSVRHGNATYSDDYPILSDTKGCIVRERDSKPFKFEEMWIREEECRRIIEQGWHIDASDGSVNDIMQRPTHYGGHLKQWNKACLAMCNGAW